MEGLHNRKNRNVEDEAEFLDEQEQEQLLQTLRDQNNTANLTIQRGLIIIGCIASALFFHILFQSDTPIIPISQVFSTPTASVLPIPTLAALSSIVSIGTSIFALVIKCKMNIFGLLESLSLKDQYTSGVVLSSIITGFMAPCMSLLYGGSMIEFIYWSVPLLVLGMFYTALYMINQVQEGLDELEKSKYKYKGA
ncbi:hypothetical protein EDC94DRAFT_696300 [Helicostylum pulchrum]|uniref:Uncharacterized protein n=1 Tax=Helicostylum pulchrum TaxID=562976 RepID=A0ABP9Y1W4_9FUNG|nr:hypothetical protein EDC94DRAFT_696300 [Helicostylum pulchrum]